MEIDEEELLNMAKKISSLKELTLENIPEIDLYMDQITSFMNDKLQGFKRNEDDQILTKTMINNYAKAGILESPVKKKYSREHMAKLILIYHLKQVLSINDIALLFSKKGKDGKLLPSSLTKTYSTFSKILVEESAQFYEGFSKKLDSFKAANLTSENDSLLLTVLILSIRSGIEKRMAEMLIDNYYKGD